MQKMDLLSVTWYADVAKDSAHLWLPRVQRYENVAEDLGGLLKILLLFDGADHLRHTQW